MADLLELKDLTTYFFAAHGVVQAVDGVSLSVGEQETVGLVGESGSGKSTAALSIMRLVPRPGRILGGSILFRGRDLVALDEASLRGVRGKEIAMVFQDPLSFLNPVMRVRDQVAEIILSHSERDRSSLDADIVEAMKEVGIADPQRVMKSYPHQLSGGMRQRVLIAMAIIGKPSLIIADEPTSALDVTVQAQILDLIKQLKEELKLSLLLITHDLGIAADICDRVYVMYAGRIAEGGDVFSVYEDPKHPYTQGLLRSALSVDEFRKELFTIEGVVPDLVDPPKGCRFNPRCAHVMPVCREEDPIPFQVGKDQTAFCWLYGDSHGDTSRG